MVIKHLKQHSNTKEQANRLAAYIKQGRSYRSTQKNRKLDTSTLLKGSLAALIPLAAASTLNAQCQGPVNGGDAINIPRNGQFYLDVDGDGVDDFRFRHYHRRSVTTYTYTYTTVSSSTITYPYYYTSTRTVLYLRPLGQNHFRRNLPRLSAGIDVTRGQGFRNSSTYLFDYSNTSGGNIRTSGNFGAGARGYVGIRNGDATTGTPGWFELEVVSVNSDGARIIIHERGYDVAGNNTATTGDCASLPVEMLYFNTKASGKDVLLEWATASEINNEGFEVQRSSDGNKFSKVGWVQGNGNSTERHTYTFTDNAAKPNTTYYYRLKQMDMDGTEAYSEIRSISLIDKSRFNISEAFPNPTSHDTNFEVNMPEAGAIELSVFDLKGRVIKSQTTHLAKGTSSIRLQTTDSPSGQYYVKLQAARAVEYRKLLVQ